MQQRLQFQSGSWTPCPRGSRATRYVAAYGAQLGWGYKVDHMVGPALAIVDAIIKSHHLHGRGDLQHAVIHVRARRQVLNELRMLPLQLRRRLLRAL